LGWDYEQTLEEGIRKTYTWIDEQVQSRKLRKENSLQTVKV